MVKIKSLLCSFMLLAVTLPVASQSLRDYIRSRSGGSDSLVLKAVSPALTIIRQQYRLERNNEFYGKNNLPFYGESYTLGVKVPGSTIIQHDVIFPWENDDDFQKINKGGKYRPVYYKSFQRQWTGKNWELIDLELGSQYVSILSPDSLLFCHIDAVSNFGLSIDNAEGNKNGYLIWAYYSVNRQDSSVQVKLKSTNYQANVKSDSATVIVKPENSENLIGGIYVVPIVERTGYIKLQLAGVISSKSRNDWRLSFLTKREDDVTKTSAPEKRSRQRGKKDSEEIAPPTDDNAEGLAPTPIK